MPPRRVDDSTDANDLLDHLRLSCRALCRTVGDRRRSTSGEADRRTPRSTFLWHQNKAFRKRFTDPKLLKPSLTVENVDDVDTKLGDLLQIFWQEENQSSHRCSSIACSNLAIMELDLIRRVPVSMFGIGIGTAGQVSVWSRLANNTSMERFVVGKEASEIFWVLGVIVLVLVCVLYTMKIVLYPRSVRTEFHCYYQSNFFVMPFLCLTILSANLPERWFSRPPSSWLLVGLVPLLLLEMYLYGEWMYGVNRSLRLANPAFQLAVVGNFLGAGLAAETGENGLAVGLFAIGVLYLGLVLAAIHTGNNRVKRNSRGEVVQKAMRRRLTFMDKDQLPVLHPTVGRVVHNPWSVKSEIWALPAGLQPTLFLCIAPPAVAALAWSAMNKGTCDGVCQGFFSVSFFFFGSMIIHLQRFMRRTPFSVAVWAFTFPSAALAAAAIEFADESGEFMVYLALLLSIVAIGLWCGAVVMSVLLVAVRGVEVMLSPGSEVTEDPSILPLEDGDETELWTWSCYHNCLFIYHVYWGTSECTRAQCTYIT